MCSVGKVSIIIPNHGRDINDLINSIHNSTYKDYEIIVVDEGFERSKQRNIGIDRAKGAYLLFLDSDMQIAPDLLENCIKEIKYCGGLYIPEIIKTKGIFGAIRRWERQFYTGTPIDVVRFVNAYQCPYFDERMSGPEDSDWDRRIPSPKLVSKSYVYHYDNIGIIGYIKKKIYYTKSMDKFRVLNPDDKVLDFKYRCWGVFVENGKWKLLIKNPLFTLALIFLLGLRGIIYLWNKP